jgi:Spy/CpxP family protein refolding chaperone
LAAVGLWLITAPTASAAGDPDDEVIPADPPVAIDGLGDIGLLGELGSVGDSGGEMMLLRGDAGGGSADRILDAADKLDLTDAQKTKLREIRRRGPGVLMPKRQAVVEARMDLRDLMDEKGTSGAELRKAHDRLLEANKDLSAARFDLRMQAREVLTPEQREKLPDLRVEIRHQIRDRIHRLPRAKWHRFDLRGDEGVIIEKF